MFKRGKKKQETGKIPKQKIPIDKIDSKVPQKEISSKNPRNKINKELQLPPRRGRKKVKSEKAFQSEIIPSDQRKDKKLERRRDFSIKGKNQIPKKKISLSKEITINKERKNVKTLQKIEKNKRRNSFKNPRIAKQKTHKNEFLSSKKHSPSKRSDGVLATPKKSKAGKKSPLLRKDGIKQVVNQKLDVRLKRQLTTGKIPNKSPSKRQDFQIDNRINGERLNIKEKSPPSTLKLPKNNAEINRKNITKKEKLPKQKIPKEKVPK